jgi:multiple sugar transport system substrate-binding protein
MTRTTRRTIVLAALTAVALAVSGCGRDSGDDKPEQGKKVAQGKAKGDITVWAMGTEGEKLTTLADDFMKENPDAHVKITPVPWDGAHDKISAAIAGQETPDVTMLGTTWVSEFAKSLDVVPPDFVNKDDFFPSAWSTGVVDDTAYGVPWYVETRLLYVNKAVAEKAGITEAPKDWDALKQDVKDMQAKGGAKWGIYMQPGQTGAWQTAMPFVWQNGGDVWDGKDFTFDSPEVTEGLDYYGSFYKEGLATRDRIADGQYEPQFLKGDIGAFVSGPWHIGLLDDQGGKGKYELWPMPQESGDATSFIGGSNMSVFKDSKNRDGAWKFVSYLMKPDVQVKWYETVKDLPAVQKAWDDQTLSGDELLKTFGEQLEKGKAPPAIPTWEAIAAGVDTELEKIAKGTESASDAAKAMQADAEQIGTTGS